MTSLSANDRLNQYEVITPIGRGGMGEVYRARDTQLGRDVAIKVLPDALAEDEEYLSRFEREARLLASLNHPNVATLHGLERQESKRFLVMELVEGETLEEIISRGPLATEEVAPLFRQIAEGLEAAHDQGIIHRDLKPANIKITPDGKAKILDFGLAKGAAGRASPSGQLSESPTVMRGTMAGVILGTAPYMSPEQARGQAVDHRSDIWAFGCCLYEALSGDMAFPGDSVSDAISAVLTRAPNWERLPRDTPPALTRLLKRCLEKKVQNRLQAIGDARIELTEEMSSPGRDLRRFVNTAWLVPLASALVASAVTAWLVLSSVEPVATGGEVHRFVLPLPENSEIYLAKDFHGAGSVALSPDGRRLAYVIERDGEQQLYLRSLERPSAERIPGIAEAKLPFFSHDSQWLGFFDGERLQKISVTGGAGVTLAEERSPKGATWGPNGEIVYGRGPRGGLILVSDDGSRQETLTVPNRDNDEKTHRFPHFLPGGKSIVFTIGGGSMDLFDSASIAVLSLETREYRVVLEGGTYPRYSPSGHLLYASAGELLAVPFDLETLEVSGAPVTVLDDLTMLPSWATAMYDISPNGTLLYAPGEARHERNRILWVGRSGDAEPLSQELRRFQGSTFRLSPDGASLALTMQGASNSVWIYDIGRGALRRLASGFDNDSPTWTPDGQRVAFLSNRDGAEATYWQTADGSGSAERLTEGTPNDWSPDGSVLAYHVRGDETGLDIWSMSVTDERTRTPLLQTTANEQRARFSPDGSWVAYESDETGRSEIYMVSYPEPSVKRQVSTSGGIRPAWNPAGGELFYRSGAQLMAVTLTLDPLALGRPRVVFEMKAADEGFDVTRDGNRFVMMEPVASQPPPHELMLVLNWSLELARTTSPE